MPQNLRLSALLNEKLKEHSLLKYEYTKRECIDEIRRIVVSRFDELCLDDLLIRSNAIPSILWVISSENYVFLKAWQRFGQQIPLVSLLEREAETGKSALWHIIDAAGFGQHEAFLAVWERFSQQIPLEEILTVPKESHFKELTTLWLLSVAAFNGKPEAFMAVWQRFGQQIPLVALLTAPQEGYGKGKSVLWFLSAAAKNKSEAFLAVWQRFGQQIPLEALLSEPEKGRVGNVLWNLSIAAGSGKPEAFMAVWQCFSQLITLETLLAGGNDADSALLYICMSSDDKRLNLLFNQKRWQIDELLKGCSALYILSTSVDLNIEWWETLLQQKKGILPESKLDFFDEHLKVRLEKLKLMPLVNARNRFFNILNSELPLSEDQIKNLFEEANKATDAGYTNAFYDLGHFLAENVHHELGIEALKQVPNSSCHYANIMIELSEMLFASALAHLDNQEKRLRYLVDSLHYGLQTDDDNRIMLIQRIASIYIEGKKTVGDSQIVPQEWLEAMNSGTSVEWCMNRFHEIKHLREIERELKEKNDTLNIERTTMKHLLARMETLESENQALKKQKSEVAQDKQSRTTKPNETLAPMILFRTPART